MLSVDGLQIRFGGLVAINHMTFEVREGEVLSLIGPNGAGKTTAFNAITGYLRPADGDIVYRGKNLVGLRPNEIAELGVVRTFQKTSLFGGQTVFNNVLIGLHLRSKQRPLAIILGLASIAQDERAFAAAAWDILRFMGLDARAPLRFVLSLIFVPLLWTFALRPILNILQRIFCWVLHLERYVEGCHQFRRYLAQLTEIVP